jgi:hypothetical protein
MYDDQPKIIYKDSVYNPLNRFFFLFSHSSKVETGWAIPFIGWNLLPFSCGIYIFSFLMTLYLANDLVEIPAMEYFKEHDGIFKLFFAFQIISDIFLVIGIVEGLYSACGDKLIPGIVAYYSLIICFLFHSAFCVYTILQLKQFYIELKFVSVLFEKMKTFTFEALEILIDSLGKCIDDLLSFNISDAIIDAIQGLFDIYKKLSSTFFEIMGSIQYIFDDALKILGLLERLIELLLKGEFFTIGLWLLFDYVMFKFSWFLFCNWVNLRRKRREQLAEQKEQDLNI